MIKNFILSFTVSLALLGCTTPSHSQTTSMETPTEVSENMFRWWNTAFVEGGFTASGFAEYFADDFEFVINDRAPITDHLKLAEHFQRIQASSDLVEIELPYLDSFESDGRVFTYHSIKSVRNGVEAHVLAMGFIDVEDAKITKLHLLQYMPAAATEDE